MSTLAPTLQAFFTDRLIRQRQASPHTIAAYRDTFKLLLAYAFHHAGIAPSQLRIEDLDAPLIGAFLSHLELERGNSIRTRNTRLAAIHSLFRYAALHHPDQAASIQRVLAIPPKRFDRGIVTYLTDPEIDALLQAPDKDTWTGRRDHTLLAVAIQTGLRASELTTLTIGDVHLGSPGAHISCHGKGRKQRVTPLTSTTVTIVRAWLTERAPPDTAVVTSQSDTADTNLRITAAVNASIAAIASAHGLPAGAGITGSGSNIRNHTVNSARTGSSRAAKRRSQPRTVSTGRASATAIRRNPAPAAFAASAAPITTAKSARRSNATTGNNTCVAPQPAHRDRRGRNRVEPSEPRSKRSRP